MLNVGWAVVRDVVCELSGMPPEAFGALATQRGEAGEAAEIALAGHVAAAPTLTLDHLMACFSALVEARGPTRKRPLLAELLGRATPVEAKYIIKIMGGDLRIGLQEGQLEDALARAAGLEEALDLLGFVPDDRLALAYRDAAAFVFPSRYEGFGLPPLEAMAAGCPVIASPCGALPEVLGEAAWIAPLEDVEAWARAVVMLHRDVGRRRQHVDAGRAHAARFTWDRVGRETWEVYRSILEPAPQAPVREETAAVPPEGSWPRPV